MINIRLNINIKIINELVLLFSTLALAIGVFDGTLAYQDEILFIMNYKTDYSHITNFFTLLIILAFRYFKYIIIIQFFMLGYFSKLAIIVTSALKSYSYSFVLSIIIINYEGRELLAKLGLVFIQMTASLIITLIYAQISENFVCGAYPYYKKYKIQFFAFVFSFICCIIIAMIDFLIIQFVF